MAAGKPFDDRDGYIWMNGEFIPWRDARVHVLTHALHYASSVFEGQRAYNGTVFKLEEHTARLFYSAGQLGMTVPYSQDEINQACRDILVKNNFPGGNAYQRPVVWRSSDMMGVASAGARVFVAIAAWEWPSYFTPEARMKGLRLQMSDWKRPSPETIPCKAKAAGLYMICTLSKDKAERDGFDDSLMLDYRGYVAEATGANIFFLMDDGKIHTPLPDCFLNGITRQTAIALAKEAGYEVVERHIKPEEMANASECFITGTAVEVTPVAEIGPYKFTPDALCKRLMEDYEALVNGRKALASSAA